MYGKTLWDPAALAWAIFMPLRSTEEDEDVPMSGLPDSINVFWGDTKVGCTFKKRCERVLPRHDIEPQN